MSISLQHAIILAAGLGKRMRPLTLDKPKPMITVQGKSLINHNLDWLKEAGIKNVTVNTSYLAEKLEAHLLYRNDINITLSREGAVPLETGGGIAQALPFLGKNAFLSMNSDAIFPVQKGRHPIIQLGDAWNEHEMDFLMLLVPKKRARGLHGKADFCLTGEGNIQKPKTADAAEYAFTGVEIIHPRMFKSVPGTTFSLRELWEKSLDQTGIYRRVYGFVLDMDWLHVGDLAGLDAAEAYFAEKSRTLAS